MIKFLCGCTSLAELPIPDEAYFSTFDSVVLDAEGFIQCAIHRQRRYGWRAPSHSPRYSGMGDYEYERWMVWGEIVISEESQSFGQSFTMNGEIPDLRPHIYEGMLDEHALGVIARVSDPNFTLKSEYRPSISSGG